MGSGRARRRRNQRRTLAGPRKKRTEIRRYSVARLALVVEVEEEEEEEAGGALGAISVGEDDGGHGEELLHGDDGVGCASSGGSEARRGEARALGLPGEQGGAL